MEDAIKDSFIQQFKGLFGIPLFQEISNYEFFYGKVDKYRLSDGIVQSFYFVSSGERIVRPIG